MRCGQVLLYMASVSYSCRRASVSYSSPREDVHVTLLKHGRTIHSDKKQHARAFVVTKCTNNSLLSTDDNLGTCCVFVQIHVSLERPV